MDEREKAFTIAAIQKKAEDDEKKEKEIERKTKKGRGRGMRR